MTTWPSMVGVTIMALPEHTGARRTSGGRSTSPCDARDRDPALPLAPRRRGVPHLAVGEVVGPDGDLLAVLPLQHRHLVGNLEAVLIHLVVAERRLQLQLQQSLADLVGIEGPRPLHRLRVDETSSITRRGVIHGLPPELLLVRVGELLLARIGQRALP